MYTGLDFAIALCPKALMHGLALVCLHDNTRYGGIPRGDLHNNMKEADATCSQHLKRRKHNLSHPSALLK